MTRYRNIGRQSGAALVVGLILLVVVTVLAISGMNTATTELAMARNDQIYENTFQAAETGLELGMAQSPFSTIAGTTLTRLLSDTEQVTVTVQFENSTFVPDRAFSLGAGSGIAAYHFIATSTAESKRTGVGGADTDRDATATHTQAFYVVGPAASTF